ncbi:MAG: energy-coupling factor ABC transporter ATP-binding protein [Treponema sp.]|jgi:energy-coupling factor transport system ATP-binding protein|nr:energy-coupling factor ABC transporter ATP-binding protein [Treponema sp.]
MDSLLTPAALRIEHVYYSWDSQNYSLEDIDVTIHDNEFTAIIGQNGAGKSTLLKNITGLLRPSRGSIYIRGKNAREMTVPQIAAETGFVMQNPDRQLFSATVYDEVSFALKNVGLAEREIRRRTEESLETVGLSGQRDAFPPALGRGDRTKTVIAAVLAMGSKIIILDEPVAGQDYSGSRRIMDIAAELREKGRTIIIVTHNIAMAAEYARRILVMHEKRIYMDGRPEAVFCRFEELAKANILPPPVARLSRELQKELPLERIAMTTEELARMLINLKKKQAGGT